VVVGEVLYVAKDRLLPGTGGFAEGILLVYDLNLNSVWLGWLDFIVFLRSPDMTGRLASLFDK